jgi:hypothetical protein
MTDEEPQAAEVEAVDEDSSALAARGSRVRVVLRIRPLQRREYGYPLAAEKQSHNRQVEV